MLCISYTPHNNYSPIISASDLHGILMAPQDGFDGVFDLAALVQICATMPYNNIACEYPVVRPGWGVEFKVDAALKYLSKEDLGFFD